MPASLTHCLAPDAVPDALAHLEESLHRQLDELAFFSPQSWVPPRLGPGCEHVYDVVVIGGGQAGLATAFGLLLAGIKRIVVLESAPDGCAGPWTTHARMRTLRTPKNIRGPELGVLPLAFQSWYEAAFGPGAYDALDNIPTDVWWRYLGWFRRVLDLPVQYERTVVDLHHDAGVGALRLVVAHHDATAPMYARKVVLCTGLAGCGGWNVPHVIEAHLPRACYEHTAEPIDFTRLAGRRVGIIGAGLSSFDAARAALRAGAAEVHHFCRRTLARREPFGYLWQGRDDGCWEPHARSGPPPGTSFGGWRHLRRPADLLSAFVAHVRDLDDARRWRFLRQIFHQGQSTATVAAVFREPWPDTYHFHERHPIEGVALDGDAVRLDAGGARYDLDHLLLGTGVTADLRRRPELRSVAEHVATWRDRFAAADGEDELASFPYLGPAFELCERVPGTAPWVTSIFGLIDPLILSVGIHALQHDVRRLVDGVAAQLFADTADDHLAFLEAGVRELH